VNPVNLVSVGASGALMALFAALFVAGFHFPSGTAARTSLQVNSLRILIPSLLPLLQTSAVGRIDYGAHIGGMLSGAAFALLLLRCWPEGARTPQLRNVAAAVSAAGAILFVASGALATANYLNSVHPLQPADVLEDHGPRRAACDFQWSTLDLHDAASYRAFLQKCMYGNATTPR
jgi:rhomboid protease GluP